MKVPPSDPAPAFDENAARWFAEEVEPHEFRLRAWLAARFPHLRDLDDVVQDAYVRLFKARRSGGIRSAQAFLFRAARNAACDVFRRQKDWTIDRLDDVEETLVIERTPSAADVAASNQELELLSEAIRLLPERCRQVFTLRKVYGLSQREAAAFLGISEHTVEVQMSRGIRRCAAYLRAQGISR
jgi:RNA polymerase sigma-70 factor (ECF subfamily)